MMGKTSSTLCPTRPGRAHPSLTRCRAKSARGFLEITLTKLDKSCVSGIGYAVMPNFYQQVYALVAQIPRGRVMTYGQIAVILGKPTAARAVGYALHQSPPGMHLPWQRVINAQGKISPRGAGDVLHEPSLQRILLEAEGIRFDAQGRIDLTQYLWAPADADFFEHIFQKNY